MKITIITLYDDRLCEHYVGAVRGTLTDEEKRQRAEALNAVVSGDDGSHEEDERTIGFLVVDLAESAGDLTTLVNIWDDAA